MNLLIAMLARQEWLWAVLDPTPFMTKVERQEYLRHAGAVKKFEIELNLVARGFNEVDSPFAAKMIYGYARDRTKNFGEGIDQAVEAILYEFATIVGDDVCGVGIMVSVWKHGLVFQHLRDAIAWLSSIRDNVLMEDGHPEMDSSTEAAEALARTIVNRIQCHSSGTSEHDLLIATISRKVLSRCDSRSHADIVAEILLLQADFYHERTVKRNCSRQIAFSKVEIVELILDVYDRPFEDMSGLTGKTGLDLFVLACKSRFVAKDFFLMRRWLEAYVRRLQAFYRESDKPHWAFVYDFEGGIRALAQASKEDRSIIRRAPSNLVFAVEMRDAENSGLTIAEAIELVCLCSRVYHLEHLSRWFRGTRNYRQAGTILEALRSNEYKLIEPEVLYAR